MWLVEAFRWDTHSDHREAASWSHSFTCYNRAKSDVLPCAMAVAAPLQS